MNGVNSSWIKCDVYYWTKSVYYEYSVPESCLGPDKAMSE